MSKIARALVVSLLLGSAPVLTSHGGAAASAVHQVMAPPSLLTEPNDGFTRIYHFIAGAKKSIDIAMYEMNDQQAERDLIADATRGVDVRILLDSAYVGRSYNASAFAYLTGHGVQVHWAPSGTIVHEKSIVVDNKIALIATFNLGATSNYYATTRDFGYFDADPVDVAAIVRVFDRDFAGRTIAAPSRADDGHDLVWSPGALPDLVSLISGAKHTLLVENEEMDDVGIVQALAESARRGVDVEVVMNNESAWRANFDRLVYAGVHVRIHSGSTSLFIHAKVIVADVGMADQRMFLGSENFSVSSLEYNRELGVVLSTSLVISAVADTIRSDYLAAEPWTS